MDSDDNEAVNSLSPSDARQFSLLDRVDYRLAETDAERDAIYRLRYRAYLNEGAIEPNSAGRVTDRFDEMPNSWLIGVFLEDELMSSVRVSASLPGYPETPSFDVFPEHVGPLLAAGKRVVDPTRFVADPEHSKRLRELPFVTLRAGWLGCGHFKADIGLASVRTEHRAFYQRLFMQQVLAEARAYPGLTKPICLLSGDYPAVCNAVMERLPSFRSTHFERRTLFTRRAGAQSGSREPHEMSKDRLAVQTR